MKCNNKSSFAASFKDDRYPKTANPHAAARSSLRIHDEFQFLDFSATDRQIPIVESACVVFLIPTKNERSADEMTKGNLSLAYLPIYSLKKQQKMPELEIREKERS